MQKAPSRPKPDQESFPRGGNRTAILFVHGLMGHYRETWGDFPQLIFQDSDLSHCDVLCWGYPSPPSLLRLPFVGRRTPDLALVSRALRTSLGDSAFGAPYSDLIIVAHSMGGLIVLRALLDSLALGSGLLGRVRHLLLYASPTQGVQLPGLARAHPQACDLREGSAFVEQIGKEWRKAQEEGRIPFPVIPVLGEEDNAVPPTSAEAFWPAGVVQVIPGTHTEMCKPWRLDHPAFTTLKKAIQTSTIPHVIRPHGALTLKDVQRRLVQEAREFFYATGSRSSQKDYLEAIEQELVKRPKLAHYRILMGPPRSQELKDHLLRLLALRDSRTGGDAAIGIGLYDNPSRQAEVFICGNENRCLVVLPSPVGISHYSTGVVFTDKSLVDGYWSLVWNLFEASSKLQTASALRAPEIRAA